MYIPLILGAGAAVMLLQLFLCFRCTTYFRYVPMFLLTALEMALWCCFFLVRPGFYTYYMGIVGFFLLVAVLFAWAVWVIIQCIQKRK